MGNTDEFLLSFCILLTASVLARTSAAEQYDVGVLMVQNSTTNRFDLEHIGPAIDIAQERCLADYNVHLNLLPGYYKHGCSEVQAIGKATDLTRDNKFITAYVGPACSDDLQVVGCFATYRGIPIVTGLGDVLRNREEFTTLIRVSYDLKDKARAILAFLEHFKWVYFGMIYRHQDVYYGTLAEEVMSLAERGRHVITCKETYVRAKNKTVLTDLTQVVKRLKECARVIVILGGDREVRQMMLIAQDLGMTTGEYAFLYPELFQSEARGNVSWSSGKNDDESKRLRIKEAYQALMIVSLHQPVSEKYSNFSKEVKKRAKEKYNYGNYREDVVNYFTASFHDAVLMLCWAINQTLMHKEDPRNGTILISRMKNSSFQGVSGKVTINNDGDRIADYALLDQTDPKTGNFEVVLKYLGASDNYSLGEAIHWPNGRIPKDRPLCGFDGRDPICQDKSFSLWEIVLAGALAFTLVCLVCGVLIYRKMKLEAALSNMSWRVRWEEITFTKNYRTSWMMSRLSITSVMSSKMERGWVCWTPHWRDSSLLDPLSRGNEQQQFILTGVYKGNTVAVKRLPRQKRIELTRSVLMELKIMREAQHDNIVRFVGACIDPPNMAILTEYCPKGSLQDVLHNESLKLDWMFRYSLINDIVKGMCYLHNSDIGSHGRLRSSNCVVDSHFVLKITDFGLPSFRQEENYSDSFDLGDQSKLLWKAPELLRLSHCPPQGTQKGDVYSFGIILQEIIVREGPFYPHHEILDVSDILIRVKLCEEEPFRPIVEKDACIKELYSLMERCWQEDPDDRPDFSQIKSEMRSINRGQHGEVNIMDNLLIRMEQYANNLEVLVEQRTAAFLEEKRKSEELLYQVLPRSVAEQLKRGRAVIPELFDSVTIYFSDIVGFTAMCSVSTPMEVVDFLNSLYTCFDSIISDFDVYKVETIGDAYMVVSGLPDRNGLNHAREIARMALSLLRAVDNFTIRHRPNEKLMLRIGIHTGPCCAGVVGQRMPRYCLFGDTVNTASRMESTGEPLKIHVSPSTKAVLEQFGNFVLVPRGEVDVKGKGKMQTFWLVDEVPLGDPSYNTKVRVS